MRLETRHQAGDGAPLRTRSVSAVYGSTEWICHDEGAAWAATANGGFSASIRALKYDFSPDARASTLRIIGTTHKGELP